MTATPAIEGWFTTGAEPALLGSRCTTCTSTYFPPIAHQGSFCRNPACNGEEFETVELSRRGRIWSYTDAQYQPPAALHRTARRRRGLRAVRARRRRAR